MIFVWKTTSLPSSTAPPEPATGKSDFQQAFQPRNRLRAAFPAGGAPCRSRESCRSMGTSQEEPEEDLDDNLPCRSSGSTPFHYPAFPSSSPSSSLRLGAPREFGLLPRERDRQGSEHTQMPCVSEHTRDVWPYVTDVLLKP